MNDCGSSGGNRYRPQHIEAYLGNRIGDVVAVLISHPDRDHFNYIPFINWTVQNIQAVIIGGVLQDYNRTSTDFRAIYNWLTNFNSAGRMYVVSGGTPCIGNCTVPGGINFCINFNILAANVRSQSNQKSIVMKVTFGAFNALLPGDMEGPASTVIAGDATVRPLLRSYIYKIAHHGASRIANSPAWLAPISPQLAFASSGYNFGNCKHPRCDTIKRLLALNTLAATTPHNIYCGNTGGPRTINGFAYHIYETSPNLAY